MVNKKPSSLPWDTPHSSGRKSIWSHFWNYICDVAGHDLTYCPQEPGVFSEKQLHKGALVDPCYSWMLSYQFLCPDRPGLFLFSSQSTEPGSQVHSLSVSLNFSLLRDKHKALDVVSRKTESCREKQYQPSYKTKSRQHLSPWGPVTCWEPMSSVCGNQVESSWLRCFEERFV